MPPKGWLGVIAIVLVYGHGFSRADSEISPSPTKKPPISAGSHWAFQPLKRPPVPDTGTPSATANPIDRFLAARLASQGLALGPEADRPTLIRRVSFLLTGLPPTPGQITAFVRDRDPGAWNRMVESYLASPHYGERWAKHWLDAAGYADSNGYFSADSDRPLAYRYRDYVIRSHNRDLPFDQFVRQQLAGDESCGWKPGQPVTPEIIESLEATHYLRNGQDGSGESDGNPDEVRTDRYYALESTMQIMGSSLLGLTVQCAKCHDHKFEPITQKDYYSFQSFLYPAFPIEKWSKPNDRVVYASLPGELETWERTEQRLQAEQKVLREDFHVWVAAHQPRGKVLFADRFDDPAALASHWSNTAPGDDAPGGTPPVTLNVEQGPAARIRDGALDIIEGGGSGDRWLSTVQSFDWRPARTGEWIQVTFDLVASRLTGKGTHAERIGYFIATHDFNNNSPVEGGNILVDGNPGGASSVQVDYPGTDAKGRGAIGISGYKAGRNYGVRVTRKDRDKLTLEHVVDGVAESGTIELKDADLPPGGFGFEYCCGRSFIVDNVLVEASRDDDPEWAAKVSEFRTALEERRKTFEQREKEIASQRSPKPGGIAWVTDASAEAPEVRMLKRGNHKTPGDPVEPTFPAFLRRTDGVTGTPGIPKTPVGTGRRTAWAAWVTDPGSPQAGLLARVTVNRVWQRYFGVGIVATPDNFGLSGARPSNPELLEWLAAEFVDSGWSLKSLHRTLLQSAAFRQSSAPHDPGLARDPADIMLWRFPLRRLDAEAIRDAMLASGERLGTKTGGPYVPTPRDGSGEVAVDESQPEAFSRSIFLQQRRTQVPTFMGNFDAPSMVFNCTRRADTTMPLQSLSLLNSTFVLRRGEDLAGRLHRECGEDILARVRRGYVITTGREPDPVETSAMLRFIETQRQAYAGRADAAQRVWSDFSQSLFALNSFLYLE